MEVFFKALSDLLQLSAAQKKIILKQTNEIDQSRPKMQYRICQQILTK
jgi:hypothetical protein